MIGMVSEANALALADCTRTTHVSHGGEADHRDMGEGRVMWRAWWSQEGTFTDIVIADCASGEALRFRTAEERMSERPPFDRNAQALMAVEKVHEGARVFATLPRVADAVRDDARDVQIANLQTEPCACASLYPDLRGNRPAFVLGG